MGLVTRRLLRIGISQTAFRGVRNEKAFLLKEGHQHGILASELAGSSWSDHVITVDADDAPALTRFVGRRWAIITELPTTVVTIAGHGNVADRSWGLADVRDRLSDYQ